jgi:hypothetical protein
VFLPLVVRDFAHPARRTTTDLFANTLGEMGLDDDGAEAH